MTEKKQHKLTKPNSGIDYVGLEELENCEVMHNYNSRIVAMAVKYSGAVEKIADFGAGIGTLALIFKSKYSMEPICIEPDGNNQKYLEERQLTTKSSLAECQEHFDLIFSSNVLEHIMDDIATLEEIKKKLTENGKVFLYLPAHRFLWSSLDEKVGHHRRYSQKDIETKCIAAGLRIQTIHFSDSLGLLASLLIKIVGYNNNLGIGSAKSLEFYDRWIFPFSAILDRVGFKHIMGKNIVVVATPEDT